MTYEKGTDFGKRISGRNEGLIQMSFKLVTNEKK